MPTIRVRHDVSYTCISNAAIQDKRLSFKARGLHHLLLSYPDGWEINTDHLIKESDRDGRDAINSALKELKDHRYLVRRCFHNPDTGRFDWVSELYELPLPEDEPGTDSTVYGFSVDGSPVNGSPVDGSTVSGKPVDILSTDRSSTKGSSTDRSKLRDRSADRAFDRALDEGRFLGEEQIETPVTSAYRNDSPCPKSEPLPKTRSSSRARASKKIDCDAVYRSLTMPEQFAGAWSWYCKKLNSIPPDPRTGRRPGPGSKVLAALAWKEEIEAKGQYRLFRIGCWKFDFSQPGVPHFCRFVAGTKDDSHPSPYWKDAIDESEALSLAGSTEFDEPPPEVVEEEARRVASVEAERALELSFQESQSAYWSYVNSRI